MKAGYSARSLDRLGLSAPRGSISVAKPRIRRRLPTTDTPRSARAGFFVHNQSPSWRSPKSLTYPKFIQPSGPAVLDLAMSTSAPRGLAVHDELQGPAGLRAPASPQPEPPLSQFQSTIDCSAHAGRRFKACRVCRRHKLKCERSDDGTCQRCRDNGVRCVYDTIGSRTRDAAGKRGDIRTRRFVESSARHV